MNAVRNKEVTNIRAPRKDENVCVTPPHLSDCLLSLPRGDKGGVVFDLAMIEWGVD